MIIDKAHIVEVLEQVKAAQELRKLPIIKISATDDPREIEKCYSTI